MQEAIKDVGLELPEEIKISPVHTFSDTMNINIDSLEVGIVF